MHNRAFREAFREQCKRCVPPLDRRIYTVHFAIFGHFYDKAGNPLRRDCDNIVKVALDEIARAGGIDDKWLQRRWSGLEVHESESEYAMISLT